MTRMSKIKTNWDYVKRKRRFDAFNRKNPDAKKMVAVQADGMFSAPVKEMNVLDRSLIEEFESRKRGIEPPPQRVEAPNAAHDGRFIDKVNFNSDGVRSLPNGHRAEHTADPVIPAPASLAPSGMVQPENVRAIAALKIAKPVSRPLSRVPEMRLVDPCALKIEPGYQRDLSGKSLRLIRRIVVDGPESANMNDCPNRIVVNGPIRSRKRSAANRSVKRNDAPPDARPHLKRGSGHGPTRKGGRECLMACAVRTEHPRAVREQASE